MYFFNKKIKIIIILRYKYLNIGTKNKNNCTLARPIEREQNTNIETKHRTLKQEKEKKNGYKISTGNHYYSS